MFGEITKLWVKEEERMIYFVQFPTEMTCKEIVNKLFWAKSHQVVEFYDEVIIKCWVKKKDCKHFEKELKDNIVKFEYDVALGFAVKERVYGF